MGICLPKMPLFSGQNWQFAFEICTKWQIWSSVHYRKKDSMETTQDPLNLEVLGSKFSWFMPQTPKSSFRNWRESNFLTSNSQRLFSAPTYRLQRVRAIFQEYPDELRAFWVIWKNHKTGKINEKNQGRQSATKDQFRYAPCKCHLRVFNGG